MPTNRQLLSCEALTSKAKQACESHAAPCTPPTAPLYVKVGHYLLVQRTCGGLKLVVGGAGQDGLGAPQEAIYNPRLILAVVKELLEQP